MELVDVPDSKSGVGNYVPVRPRPSANKDTIRKGGIFTCKLVGRENRPYRFEPKPSRGTTVRESRSTRRRKCRFSAQVQAVPFNARRRIIHTGYTSKHTIFRPSANKRSSENCSFFYERWSAGSRIIHTGYTSKHTIFRPSANKRSGLYRFFFGL